MNDTVAGLAFLAFLLFLLIAIGICIPVAFALEKRLKARLPQTRPYKWGFYNGCMGVAYAPFALLILGFIPFAKASDEAMGSLLLGGWFLFHTVCGVLIIRRNRWAYLLSTFFSFNIVGWIANGIYLSNRWNEMEAETLGTLPSSHSRPVTAPLASKRQSAREAGNAGKRLIPTLLTGIAILGALALGFLGLKVILPAAVSAKRESAAPTNSPAASANARPTDTNATDDEVDQFLAETAPDNSSAEPPFIVIDAPGKRIHLSSRDWDWADIRTPQSYAKYVESRHKGENEVFARIVTVFLLQMSPDRRTGFKISDSEYVEFFTVFPNSLSIHVSREKNGYWVHSNQTFALTGAEINWNYSDKETTLFRHRFQKEINRTRWLLHDTF